MRERQPHQLGGLRGADQVGVFRVGEPRLDRHLQVKELAHRQIVGGDLQAAVAVLVLGADAVERRQHLLAQLRRRRARHGKALVLLQYGLCQAVESLHPHRRRQGRRDAHLHQPPAHHVPRLLGKHQRQHPRRRHPTRQRLADAQGQRGRLRRARIGLDQDHPLAGGLDFALLVGGGEGGGSEAGGGGHFFGGVQGCGKEGEFTAGRLHERHGRLCRFCLPAFSEVLLQPFRNLTPPAPLSGGSAQCPGGFPLP